MDWFYELADGTKVHERPTDGRPYKVIVKDLARYEKIVRQEGYLGHVGHVLVDARKSTG